MDSILYSFIVEKDEKEDSTISGNSCNLSSAK